MMDPKDQQTLDKLRMQVACEKHFACINLAANDLCKGKYHSDLDVLECLEKPGTPCKYARPFDCTCICDCPLRQFIAMNFHRWSVDITAMLRRAES